MWSRHWFSCEIVTSLNEHVHFHVCVVDGVFEPMAGEEGVCDGVIFHPATGVYADTVAPVQASLRLPLQRAFVGRGLLEGLEAKEMLAYRHSGFSVDTSMCIAAHDRAGLERLLRYCARPPFALARLRKAVPVRVQPTERVYLPAHPSAACLRRLWQLWQRLQHCEQVAAVRGPAHDGALRAHHGQGGGFERGEIAFGAVF